MKTISSKWFVWWVLSSSSSIIAGEVCDYAHIQNSAAQFRERFTVFARMLESETGAEYKICREMRELEKGVWETVEHAAVEHCPARQPLLKLYSDIRNIAQCEGPVQRRELIARLWDLSSRFGGVQSVTSGRASRALASLPR